MDATAREMVWLQSFLQELGIKTLMSMPMYCDNHTAIFHERTKHIEINCHFIYEKLLMGVISTPHVSSSDQFANIFTKSIISVSYDSLRSKLGMFDLYNTS